MHCGASDYVGSHSHARKNSIGVAFASDYVGSHTRGCTRLLRRSSFLLPGSAPIEKGRAHHDGAGLRRRSSFLLPGSAFIARSVSTTMAPATPHGAAHGEAVGNYVFTPRPNLPFRIERGASVYTQKAKHTYT